MKKPRHFRKGLEVKFRRGKAKWKHGVIHSRVEAGELPQTVPNTSPMYHDARPRNTHSYLVLVKREGLKDRIYYPALSSIEWNAETGDY